MARASKTKKARQRPPRWTREDAIELIACLDYYLPNKTLFDNAVVAHLKRTRRKHFSDAQISNRLDKEWGEWGPDDPLAHCDLRSEGSACLVGYSDDDRENISNAVARMGPPPRQTRLRSVFAVPRSPGRSQTLSGPRQLSEASSFSTLSIHSTPELDDFDKIDTSTSSLKREKADEPAETDESRKSSFVGLQDDKEDDVVDSMTATVHNAACIPSQMSHTAGEIEIRVQQLERELETTYRVNAEQTNYIFTLSNRLFTAQREYAAIQHSSRAAATHQDNFTMSQSLRYEVSVYKDQLSKMRDQQQDLDMTTTTTLGPPDKIIREEFCFIKAEISDACSSVELASSIPVYTQNQMETPGGQDVVESWAQKLAGCSFNQVVSLATEAGLTEFEVLRSFAATGLCSLVFESRFPDFMAAESPLLDQYREQIFTRGGPDGLFKFDLLAHKSLMAEPYFMSHIVPERAKILSTQLLDSLRPFMPTDSLSAGRVCSSEVFQDVFNRSLILKSKLLLSGNKYKLRYFCPGNNFDTETMVRDGDTSEQFPPRKRSEKKDPTEKNGIVPRKAIKSCIFPALYLLSDVGCNQAQGIALHPGQSVIEYDNILTGENVGESREPVLIVKAVVSV